MKEQKDTQESWEKEFAEIMEELKKHEHKPAINLCPVCEYLFDIANPPAKDDPKLVVSYKKPKVNNT